MKTNTISIEIQPLFTTITVHEPWGDQSMYQSVGDGYRQHIPHIVNENAWASACLVSEETPTFIRNQLNLYENLAQTLPYIKGLYQRIVSYLGQTELDIHINGYQNVVVIHTEALTPSLSMLCKHIRIVFKTAKFISSNAALLALYLRSVKPANLPQNNVLAIAIGENTTILTLFKCEGAVFAAKASTTVPIGWLKWFETFAHDFQQRVGKHNTFQTLSFLENTFELLRLLGQQQYPDKAVEWLGANLRDLKRNNANSKYTQTNIFQLCNIDVFLKNIVNEIKSILHTQGILTKLDAIIVGGRGASWVFDFTLLQEFSTAIINDNDLHHVDISLGGLVHHQDLPELFFDIKDSPPNTSEVNDLNLNKKFKKYF